MPPSKAWAKPSQHAPLQRELCQGLKPFSYSLVPLRPECHDHGKGHVISLPYPLSFSRTLLMQSNHTPKYNTAQHETTRRPQQSAELPSSHATTWVEANGGISRNITSRHVTSRHVTSRHATPRHATPRHATPRHATPRHVTSRHVTWHGMAWHGMAWHGMA